MRRPTQCLMFQLPIYSFYLKWIVLIFFPVCFSFSCHKKQVVGENVELKHFYDNIRDLIYSNPDSLRVLSDSLILMATEVGDTDYILAGIILKANCYSFQSQYEESLDIFNSIDSVELHNSSPKVIASYYGDKAHIYRDRGEKEKALAGYQKALDIAYEIDNTRQIAAYNSNIGSTLFLHGHYQSSMNYLVEGLKYVEKLNSPQYTALVLSTMAGAYSSMKDFDKAIETSDKAIDLLNSKPQNALLVALNNKGSALVQLKKYDEAIEVLNKSLAYANEIRDSFSMSYSTASLAEVKFKQFKYNEAKLLVTENLKFELAKEMKTEASDSYLRLGRINQKLNEISEARSNFNNAIHYAELGESLEDQFKAIKGKLEFELESETNAKKYETYQVYSRLNDSLYTMEIAGAVKNAEFAYETEKKEAEISRLNSENDLKSNILIWQRWSILGLIASTLLGAFLYQVNRRKKIIQEQLNLILQEQNESLVFEKHELEALNKELKIDVESLQIELKDNSPKIIEIVKRGKKHQINTDTIKYIESEDKGCRFYFKDGTDLWDDTSLKHWVKRLTPTKFPQIHKSFIVNKTFVSWINYSKLSLYDGLELPIGRVFKKNLK